MDKPNYFEEYRSIIRALRDPQKGCPWDRTQTHESLKPCMVHEMTEAIAAIDLYVKTGDGDNLEEELGDVLLQVVLQSQIAEEEGLFTIEDVIARAGEKMLRRHPHVFGDKEVESASQVPQKWDEIKQMERQNKPAGYEESQKLAEKQASAYVCRLLQEE